MVTFKRVAISAAIIVLTPIAFAIHGIELAWNAVAPASRRLEIDWQ